jgi:outer membrane protein assembly factor BamB
VLHAYRAAYDRLAQDALQAAIAADSVAALERFLRRYFATSSGDEGLLRLSEQAWRRGWVLRARDALRRIDPRWQPHAAAAESGAPVEAVDWAQLLSRVPVSAVPDLADEVAARAGRPLGSYLDSDLPQAEVAVRLIACELLLGNQPVAEKLARVAEHWFPEETVRIAGRSGSIDAMTRWLVEEAGPWPAAGQGFSHPQVSAWSTLGGHPQRVATVGTETLQWQAAPRWVASFDPGIDLLQPLLPDTVRRSGEAGQALSVPVIDQGRVFLAGTRRLEAWERASGTPWPPGAGEGGWFETPAAPLAEAAKRLPIDVVPRLTLTAADGLIAARFGSLLTTPPDVLLDRPSGSQVCVFDLSAEGALVEGYPLAPPAGSAFEGTPLIVGSRLWVGTTHRDEATWLSRLCCYDRATGVLLWQSRPLTQFRQAGSTAQGHVSHALASYAEGIVYFHADQGAVAAVAADSGRILWQVRYPRNELAAGPFDAAPDTSGARPAPVTICGPRAIVSAADFDRVMALDPIDGRLAWMTPVGSGAEITQVLGEVDGRLILGGRQLHWIEACSGRTVARFPGRGTPQPGGGRRQPTAAGRGVLTGQQIIWPTDEMLLIFAARLAAGQRGREPQWVDQIDLRPWGLRGGHLAVAGRFLVNAGPRHVAVFPGRLRPTRPSMTLTE